MISGVPSNIEEGFDENGSDPKVTQPFDQNPDQSGRDDCTVSFNIRVKSDQTVGTKTQNLSYFRDPYSTKIGQILYDY